MRFVKGKAKFGAALVLMAAFAVLGAGCNAMDTLEEVSDGALPTDGGCSLDPTSACVSSAAGTHCKHNLDNYYHLRVGKKSPFWPTSLTGADVYRAHVVTSWCYRGGHVVSRHTQPTSGVTNVGTAVGWQDLGIKLYYSQCNSSKSTCITRYQVGLYDIDNPLVHLGKCIQTRINGDGSHSRRIGPATCPVT